MLIYNVNISDIPVWEEHLNLLIRTIIIGALLQHQPRRLLVSSNSVDMNNLVYMFSFMIDEWS